MSTPMVPQQGSVDAAALSAVTAALGRVLDMDPSSFRSDTPLTDVGCDSVGIIAFVDVLAEDANIELDSAGQDIDEALLVCTTVGDLVEVTAAALERGGRVGASWELGPA